MLKTIGRLSVLSAFAFVFAGLMTGGVAFAADKPTIDTGVSRLASW